MPYSNLIVLILVTAASVICYRRDDRSPHARYFTEVLDRIDDNALWRVERQELYEAAVGGMVERLVNAGDEHTEYISRKRKQEFEKALDQIMVGVGIRIDMNSQTNRPRVISPIFGSPAYEAGIHAGDTIMAVDGKDTKGKPLSEVTKWIKGKENETVVLTVIHLDETEPVDIPIVRKVVKIPTVLGDSIDTDTGRWNYLLEGHDDIGYVRLTNFAKSTTADLKNVLESLKRDGMRALILDLRNNPGGLLTAAVDVSDLFLDKNKVIVTTRNRDEQIEKQEVASGDGAFQDLPVVVLVDKGSASASEIVAACLKDHDVAVIIGERTYGKGTVQKMIDIEDGRSSLKLTTSSYWRPNNKNIHRYMRDGKKEGEDAAWGVKPNEGYRVELTNEQRKTIALARHYRDYPLADRQPLEQNESEDEPENDTEDGVQEKENTKDEGKDGGGDEKNEPRQENKRANGDAADAPSTSKSDPDKSAAKKSDPPDWLEVDVHMQKAIEYLRSMLDKPSAAAA